MNGKKDIDPASEDLREDDLREDEDAGLPELELEEAAAGTLAAGRAAIARYAKLAPKAPGVYRMFDAKGDVLYVGKAKNIRKRVLNYARPTAYDARIARMIAATVTMEFVSTKTESDDVDAALAGAHDMDWIDREIDHWNELQVHYG